uniref:Protein kinase domain-containing protein n=1 Tax=Oryza punctata TaxID=4537 RepID=A0A0E0M5E9_ORYPU
MAITSTIYIGFNKFLLCGVSLSDHIVPHQKEQKLILLEFHIPSQISILFSNTMGDKIDLPENTLKDYIPDVDKVKWILDNNDNITYFTEDDIKRITNNYSIKLGKGAYGEVYKGVLGDNRLVAVKKFIRANKLDEFAKEVIVHTQVNHKNVVRLVGCCKNENAPVIVFEYAANGNLSDRLYCGDTLISLGTRWSIVIECAEALGCKHSMYNPIVHCDFKPSNILLDENFHAKISDFGISRILSTGNTNLTINVRGSRGVVNTNHTSNVRGSMGYMDPTFRKEGRFTPKSDVYSFGVVLVALITKTKPTDMEKNVIRRFIQASAKRKGAKELFDVGIANGSNMKILEGIGKIAKDCMEENIDKRPEMNDVAARL